MRIIKRDGSEAIFKAEKIFNAIKGANRDVIDIEKLPDNEISEIVDKITKVAEESTFALHVEDIQDMVEDEINSRKKFKLGRAYSQYRTKHMISRNENTFNKKALAIVDYNSEETKQENSNKDPSVINVQRDYLAGEASKKVAREELIPSDIMNAHDEGIIHIHDLDYIINHAHNCDLIDLEDMFTNGTVISKEMIETPKSFGVACNVMTQIMAQVASSQYGGQSMTLSHIAPFVDVSRQKIKRKLLEDFEVNSYDELSEEDKMRFNKIWWHRLHDEIVDGVQTIQYQISTLMTSNGQTPFVTLFMYLDEVEPGQLREDLALVIEEVLKLRIKGMKNEKGIYTTPAFPKLIYVLDEDNITEDSKYWYLTKLAAECTAKRMVPDYISAKVMKELKDGEVYPCMGCRSFLTSEPTVLDKNGKRKFYSRFNQGVVTINLADVALSSNKDMSKFWDIFEDRLELCHRALRIKHERLLGTPSDAAPILWQHGGLARLKRGETIDKLLFGGYSTISLGYAALYECVYYMTGHSHTDETGREFAISVMQKLNDKCKEWRNKENIAYSVYGTPLESTTYKFAKALKKRFGIVNGVTDHDYVTNSYHINVRENINAFDKLKKEAEFQRLSPGGAISYIEIPNLTKNVDAIISIMQYMYDTILYSEFNSKLDVCLDCNFEGELLIVEDENKKLIWKCPECGCTNQEHLVPCRRTCGYLGINKWNQGRTQEIKDRVLHIDNKEYEVDENDTNS